MKIASIYSNTSELKKLKKPISKPTDNNNPKKTYNHKSGVERFKMYRSKQYLTQSEKLNIVNSKDLKDALDEDYGVLSEDIKKSLKDWLFKNPTNLTTRKDFITKIVQNTKKAEKTVEEIAGNLDCKIINSKIIKKLLADNDFNPNEYQSDKFEDDILGLFGKVGSKIFLAKLAEKREKPISSNIAIPLLLNHVPASLADNRYH